MKNKTRNKTARRENTPRLNRKYKDKLFRFVFSNKKDLLDLYNAINGTNYQNPDELTITTLDDVVFLGMKNDISFLIGCTMNLYEHQSTLNPNMPLRGFFYFADVMREYVAEHDLDIYSARRLTLPLPQYIVFYNGTKEEPDRSTLYLSESFEQKGEPALECKATMLNINYERNKKLMERCGRLEEYSYFVAAVRRYVREGYSPNEAADAAADECIKEGKLADILSKNRREVMDMLLREFDFDKYKKLVKKEAYEDGMEDGIKKGVHNKLKELVQKKLEKGLSAAEISDILEEEMDQIEALIAEILEERKNNLKKENIL